MRPDVLNPLFAEVTALPGLGPRLGKLVEKLAGPHVVDLCWHLPSGLIDRRFAPKVAEAPEGGIATLTVRVDKHVPSPNRRLPYRVHCSDETPTRELSSVVIPRNMKHISSVVCSPNLTHLGGLLGLWGLLFVLS